MNKNLEKLSSGYRINRAADDAAGLAISEKMRAQITGLDQAQDNVEDGIGLIQTAEGALQEIHDMLNRTVALATQSANGTYDNAVDRANLQKEAEALQQEINRIAKSTNFNHIPLLDGSLDGGAAIDQNFTIGGSGTGALPPVGDVPGSDTILHTTAAPGQKTEFTIDLSNVSFSNKSGETLSIAIGSATITVAGAVSGGSAMDASDIIDAILQGTNNQDNAITGVAMATDGVTPLVTIDGQEFSLTDAGGGKLKLTQVDVPDSAGEVVNGNLSVTVSGNGVTIIGTAGVPGQWNYEIKSAFGNGETLTIGGKTITFSAGGPGSNVIDVSTSTTAEQQAAAIQALFAGDGTFDVTVSGAALTFTQKTPNAGYVFTPPTVSGGATSAQVGTVQETQAYKPASPGAIGYKFLQQPEPGFVLQLTMGIWVTMTDNAQTYGQVQIGKNVVETNKNLTKYVNDQLGIPVTYDEIRDCMVVDRNGGLLGGRLGPLKQTGAPAYQEVTKADGAHAGKWTISWGSADAPMVYQDRFGIQLDMLPGGKLKDVEIRLVNAYSGDAAHEINVTQYNTLEEQIGRLAELLNQTYADYFTFSASGTVLTIEQRTPSATENVLQPWNVYAGNPYNVPDNDGGESVYSSPYVYSPDPAVPAAYGVSLNNFASGDQLTVSYGSTQKVITFYDSTKGETGGADSIDLASIHAGTNSLSKAVADILGSQFGDFDFTITQPNSAVLSFEQSTAGVGDGKTVSFQVTKSTAGSGVFTKTQTAVDAIPGGNSMTRPTTDVVDGVMSSVNRPASTFFTLTKEMAAEGNSIRIGDTTYPFGDNGVKISDLNPADADYLSKVAQRLAAAAAGNGTWTVTSDGSKIVLEEVQNQTNFDLSSAAGILKSLGYTTFGEGGLILQIGETGDAYNRLAIYLPNMDSASLGLGVFDISSQSGAQKTIDRVQKAINTVSAVRGYLGAMQNRLDHTRNSLSNTEENIQNAESAIRDADIADEMMAYTKNNILIQSAQAMLAQANQTPQSALELLQ